MTVDVLASRDVQTTLNYYVPAAASSDSPYYYNQTPPEGVPSTNVASDTYAAVVHDARAPRQLTDVDASPPLSIFGKGSLDVTGFEWVVAPSAETAFVDEERIKGVYYQEVEALLKAHTGAKRVFIFDHTIRRAKGSGKVGARGPAHRVHADQTPEAATRRVRYHLPEEAERLLKGRYRIINVWRPIGNPVAHDPLGVADFRTVDVDADLVPTRLIYPDRVGETYSIKHNPGHKWYYLSDQTPDEVTLIKCSDSERDAGKAWLTPHSAFADKTSPADKPHRQSIEVRALVFDTE